MLTKGIDGCKDIASRIRMAVIDFDAWSRLASSMTLVDFNAWRIDGGVGMLIGVDGCKDIASGITVIDDELWLKYSLRRCPIAGIPFQECINQSVEDSINFGLRKSCHCHVIVG